MAYNVAQLGRLTADVRPSLPFRPASASRAEDAGQARGVVHVVDADEDARQLLARWLTASGIEARTFASWAAFVEAPPADAPSCLVVEAGDINSVSSLLNIRCPIVMTAARADVATAVQAMKRGAFDFVEKPLREFEFVAAVCSAIEVDRKQRLVAADRAALMQRYETLSRRERQVMALVTAGKMNKQVAGDLGVSEITVKAHRGSVMRKMSARSLAALVRMADAIAADQLEVAA